ncbi:FAD-binding oxidoreductase [Actinokineospora terrae]|uniref:FAD/FMN-containing dehydrogenase n=1 Tax=Actinokineospora terrae TaxID=155974 RepID=A0A1H9WIJ1_9PSEU|nr:FAD-binding oxidoreductase [Actinokineospora terrae]SES33641.1 FAD/FMN-containing dehydrogenase [Actinokineospora terrae]
MRTRRSFLRLGAGTALASSGLLAAPTAGAALVRSTKDLSVLRERITGTVVLPSDAAYPSAKQLVSAEFDAVNPRAIVYCASTADVSASVRFARERGIPLAVRSGGHSFNGWSTTPGLVVDTSRLAHVVPGPTVRFGPGLRGVDSVAALSPHGIALPAGGCPTVSAGGFTLGGGLGWQTRKYGTASDRLVSARVVLADGRAVRASATEHSDLFWALRGGGGGNFGVVTEFESLPTQLSRVVSYRLTWSWDRAAEVVAAWQQWVITGEDELASVLVAVLPDSAPGAVPLLQVVGAHLGTKAAADAAIARLVSAVGAAPTSNTAEELPYATAMMRAFGCSDKTASQCHITGQTPDALLPRTTFVAHRYRTFAHAIPSPGIDAILTAFEANRRPGQNRSLNFVAWGGQANRLPVTATAWPHRTAQFALGFSATLTTATTPDDHTTATHWADTGFTTMTPYSTGHTYQNYGHNGLPDWQTAYYGPNYTRLTQIKHTYDRDNIFHFSQSVGS